jgi:uncharacterized damage-inducible protein DinB
MVTQIVKSFFIRDLDRLYHQISLYKDEHTLWQVDGEITNSAGNLALHLVGNLNAFIGAELGNTGYVRDRKAEFGDKDVSKEKILRDIEMVKQMVVTVIDSMTEAQLDEIYPKIVFEEPMSTKYFLIHLSTHLSYHLGQINYHRRLFDI